jgi:hypothetical protein
MIIIIYIYIYIYIYLPDVMFQHVYRYISMKNIRIDIDGDLDIV